MTASQFIAKWRLVQLTERSASQQHFLDLCALVGHATPAAADPTGEWFTFERGASKEGGGEGWADVWKRGCFGWEYKGKHKDLTAAYRQLLLYRDALENPPLLVVCDMDRIVIWTNFTGLKAVSYDIPLAEIGTVANLAILRKAFENPDGLRPDTLRSTITEKAAARIGAIAQALRTRAVEPHAAARFLDRIIFCLFAEDVGLLPAGLFARIADAGRADPARFARMLAQLFAAMAQGGEFGSDQIRHFNGNLFSDADVLDLTLSEIESIRQAAALDWAAIEPSILGTLFERGLDPDSRTQTGAHYTCREDIVTLVEPVVMAPLRREWEQTREEVESLLTTGVKAPGAPPRKLLGPALARARTEADRTIGAFLARLACVTVLDPACGSGNFLYVTLQLLKDLEKQAIDYAMSRDFTATFGDVGPWQLHGIELNPYAHDLTQMTVWIGYLQWVRDHGVPYADDPVLRPMDNFQCRDSILDLTDPAHPSEPEWPAVDYIIGNPPFLGSKMMRTSLGDEYVTALLAA